MNFKLDLKCVLIMFFILIIVHQCFKLWNSEGFNSTAYRRGRYAALKKEAAERKRKRKERKKKGIKSKKKKFNVKAWRKSQAAGRRGR
tara:strand:- start:211 stop:474 length:264 start_codon:yes stop_codon:yes gene_type:complete